MNVETLKVNTREVRGKGGARQTRRRGMMPAVVYGGGQAPLSFEVSEREFSLLIHGRSGTHAVVQLEVEDDPKSNTPALMKDVQYHPITDRILHADFQRIRLDERIRTHTSVRVTGQSLGVIEGGVLDQPLREIEVECLALEVPEEITFDVTELGIGARVHVRDLVAPDNVVFVTDADRVVISIHAPRVIEEEETVDEEIEGEEGEAPAEGEGEAAGETPETGSSDEPSSR